MISMILCFTLYLRKPCDNFKFIKHSGSHEMCNRYSADDFIMMSADLYKYTLLADQCGSTIGNFRSYALSRIEK